MKYGELAKKLKKSGCKILRQGANHEIWYNPANGRQTEVERHKGKEIATGTVHAILKDLGLK
ncbi:MAG: type II toxin-antitoxin system HicA family toxin [Lachnospiraceae bacterium]|nr:type II toxin-antitoxin system HicA family toxin [Lachnospiraceae bacterium]MCM1230016.1 type II toxin-antitoxin system HicA family toxin [Ruminococcus flavefaciens]